MDTDSKKNYINQWIMERFHSAWNGEISSNSELLNYQNLMSRDPQSMPHTRDHGMVGRLGVASPFISFLSTETGRKQRECGNGDLT